MQESFARRYKSLNAAQKQAVDTIDGPVMVVAGPGTGKTELLSMRVASILQKTDTLPENILCLTFTESGAAAMRKRLFDIIGHDAYKVAIHTFHSFGADIIQRYGEYFYDNADFTAADDLTTYEIVHSLLGELAHSNPLSSMHGGEFVYTRSIISTLSDFKRSGLTSSELLQILSSNSEVMDAIEPMLRDAFTARVSATTISLLVPVAQKAAELQDPAVPGGIKPLNHILATSLAHAIDTAQANNSTKPITAWRNAWMEKNQANQLVFKTRKQTDKLRAAISIYDSYLARLRERGLYDYDDMILEVLHALEVNAELRYNLQESYLYVLVDEYQDTNLAQSRLLTTLVDTPVAEGKPNLMIVGDDDQAIFEFQGADISNIIDFEKRWSTTVRITLTDNYRSSETVLASARDIITTIDDRLEMYSEGLDKTLTAHVEKTTIPRLVSAENIVSERQWVATDIAKRIKDGTAPNDIAIFARHHNELMELVPYLMDANIPISYEKRENILDEPVIMLVLLVCRLIQALAENEHHTVNALLPEFISHPAWQHQPSDIYRLSLAAYQQGKQWMECMLTDETFKSTANWLLQLVQHAHQQPLEHTIDSIIAEPTDTNQTPFHAYFFGDNAKQSSTEYIAAIEAVRTLRDRVRSHFATTLPTVTDLLELVDLYIASATQITRVSQYGTEDAVHVMSAHKSKGLEFQYVYIIGATDKKWGEKARSPSQKINYPANLPLARAGSSISERTRLFFVAVTRAKQYLTISYSTHDEAGKTQLPASFLSELQLTKTDAKLNTQTLQKGQLLEWYSPLVAAPHDTLREVITPVLAQYKLSPTHLGAFLDFTQGGPNTFLLYNILRFPSAMSPNAAYGSAIHATLQRAHGYYIQHGKMRALEDSQHDFTQQLTSKHLAPDDASKWRVRGIEALQSFLPYCETIFSPNQKAELGFAHQQAMINNAHLTGQLDLVTIGEKSKTIEIFDYKTGKAALGWQGKDEYEKIKLHKYRQQLLFYQLLVQASRSYHDYAVTGLHLLFVEPSNSGEIVQLTHQGTAEELSHIRELAQAVYHAITQLYLPSTDSYSKTLKGIIDFENDLIEWYRDSIDQDI